MAAEDKKNADGTPFRKILHFFYVYWYTCILHTFINTCIYANTQSQKKNENMTLNSDAVQMHQT